MDNETPQTTPEHFSRELANKLRMLRDAKGISQENVAHQAGISAYTYQKFEKGESKPGTPMNPRLFTLLALANVFEIDVRELLTFEEK
ncbi:helix-turn-helix domain-containing protein [Adlercreutzia sp. ZJ154]|uniref:helix-turn-helix domain-containing protein n=1 Tax=Adlercreutzia sp. ZJ154 TaxID=2709790 RepID=UPI0013EBEA47|nr:helix-turn-helix transcriptional regulator [Adlercreutzia sp. ZJ154]